jgi:hypothetical protein
MPRIVIVIVIYDRHKPIGLTLLNCADICAYGIQMFIRASLDAVLKCCGQMYQKGTVLADSNFMAPLTTLKKINTKC